jgi:hypothetical protein
MSYLTLLRYLKGAVKQGDKSDNIQKDAQQQILSVLSLAGNEDLAAKGAQTLHHLFQQGLGETTSLSASADADELATDAYVANIATVAIAKAATQRSEQTLAHAGCKQCLHETKFGNCREPVAASLSATFKLIAHPRFGKGCKAFKDKAIRASQELFALIDEAQRQGAISSLEVRQVHEAIAQHPNDGAYLDEWAQLIRQCLISSQQ